MEKSPPSALPPVGKNISINKFFQKNWPARGFGMKGGTGTSKAFIHDGKPATILQLKLHGDR
jgi:hypothetical protein